ncbi:sensor histidine kinase [Alicyclobacillus pomorum]|uniref:sensor histidine kinase n=1 Tax=Alicyclobacillus pomorum TaxID=204470 RepID=UPI0003F87DDA
MVNQKQEIIEKLTGIQSSRLSYYAELTLAMEQMKKKSNQLRILNQLTKIQVNKSWEEISKYLAGQLHQAFRFDFFVLSLMEGATVFSYICWFESDKWNCQAKTGTAVAGQAMDAEQIHGILSRYMPRTHHTSVALTNQMNQVFGFLTFLNHSPVEYSDEENHFFQGIADYVSVAIENIFLFKDLSKKVNLEAQLIHSAKLAAVGEMAAGVAHELNSPLTAILGNVQLLLRAIRDEPANQMLNDIFQCGLRCKKIIQNLLTFSRQDEYQYETLSLNDVVEDVLGLIGYQLQVSGITVQTRLSDDVPRFEGSRHQIEQVLINLLLNARDATQEREDARITVETGTVDTDAVGYVYVSVLDNGTGIKEEHLPQIFNPFFTTKEKFKGTGLGLSVSHGIAETHGGKLLVESKEGEFSKFTLTLPKARCEVL